MMSNPSGSIWRQALGATMASLAAYVVAMLLTVAYFVYIQPSVGPVTVLVAAYGLAFSFGILSIRLPRILLQPGHKRWCAVQQALVDEFTSANIALAAMVPVLFLLKLKWLPVAMDMDSPVGWLIMLLAALAGGLALYPLNVWKARPGRDLGGTGEGTATKPSPWKAFGPMVLSCALLAGGVWLVTFSFSAAASGTAVPSLDEAYQVALERLDLKRATGLYEQIAADGSRGDQMWAEINLAWLDLRVHDQPDEARERLAGVIRENMHRSEPLILLSRIELEQGNFAAAREAARRAQALAGTGELARDAQIHFAWATVEEATLARLARSGVLPGQATPVGATTDGPDAEALQEAHCMMRSIVDAEPGILSSSRLLLATALLLDDGDSAMLAWRSYYWVSAGEVPEGVLAAPYAVLQELLPRWQGPASPSEDRERLIRALTESRFFDVAAMVALDPRTGGELTAEARDVVAYAGFLRSLQERMDDFYREIASGPRALYPRPVLEEEMEALCQVVCSEPGNLDEVTALIRERFGARWHFRNGERDLFMGHMIVEEMQTVEQYGEQAEFRYLRLDNVVSHGVRSWLFDNLYHVGGWADGLQIVTYRPFRVKLLLNLSRTVLDPEAREAYEERVEQWRREDERRAAENPYASLPGLRGRLLQRSLEGIWAEASARGLTGSELRMRFLAELDAAWTEGPAFAHESRHVMDIRSGITDNVQLEYNAKVAETAFCRYPGIPLASNVLHPGVGPNGHGDANLRIVKDLVAWMEAHADEIEGLDRSRPLLPQLDLLSDEQLHAAVRSMAGGPACTSFCLENAGGYPVHGANLEHQSIDRGLLYVNRRNVAKEGLHPGTTGEIARWTSRYGSVTFNLVGYEYPWGGMNEAGLSYSTMSLRESQNPKPDERPPLHEPFYAQYLLDTCATVEEVMASDAAIRIMDPASHFLFCDRTGACATVEFLKGKTVYHTGEDLPVKALTNSAYEDALKAWHRNRLSDQSLVRFGIAADRVQAFDPAGAETAIDYAFHTLWLADGDRRGGPAAQWSIVFDAERGQIHFRTKRRPQIRTIDLKEIDFRCEAPALMLDIHKDLTGEISQQFEPYSHERSLEHFVWFFEVWDLDVTQDETESLVQHLEGFSCGEGEEMAVGALPSPPAKSGGSRSTDAEAGESRSCWAWLLAGGLVVPGVALVWYVARRRS